MDVAVIGMSCRFPGADNLDEFWSNLVSGKDSVTSTPKERWYMGHDLVAGYLKCPLDEFDANFFNISPKEATYIDPQHRLFLEVSWESLENAGIPATSLNGTKTGVFLGIGSDEYFRTQLDATEDTIYKIVGNSISAATGRLSFFLNLLGPSIPIEATCASSAVAIHLACGSLRGGECTMALAGGVNVLISSDSTYPSALISPRCRSFDASASGFSPAEGCGVVVLKLLKEALRDGNEVLGVIRGSYVNNTGKSTSYGTPRTLSEEITIREALKAADVNPLDVSYVEAHVGGTQIGDPVEVKAISNVFGSRNRTSPLVLGAFKTNIGHPMAAAGVAGMIKMLLCLKNRTIPPNLHLNQLHPDINLEPIPAILPSNPIPWESSSKSLIGAINCFGITGTNVHIIVEEPPKVEVSKIQNLNLSATKHSLHLLTISANDQVALEKLRSKYQEALDSDPNPDLTNFTFSANTTRSHLSHRVAVTGSSCAELSHKLSTLNYVTGTVQGMRQPIVFLFTGHGCQYFGMARGLYETSPIFQQVFDSCSVVYRNNLGVSLEKLIWNGDPASAPNLNQTKYGQPAIFVIEYCLYRLWTELGIRPDYVLGHSIGEFAACVAAGMLSFEDGMKLVCCRSILIDTVPEGRMVAVGAGIDKVNCLIENFQMLNSSAWLDVACCNSIDQTVVSTDPATADKFKEFLNQQSPAVKSKVLPSLNAFHSRTMDPILAEFEKIANEIKVKEPTCKYVSGMLSREVQPSEINGTYWKNHCRNTVSFSKSIDLLLQQGCKVFLEVSPQPILLNFVMSNNVNGSEVTACPSLRNTQDGWTTVLSSLAKLYVSTNAEIKFDILTPGAQRIQLPNYTFNRKKCWAAPNANRGHLAGTTQAQFHSLLGWKLNLAMSSDLRFYNYLSSGSTGYVQDHTILDHVIVPAACYVEMLLSLARKEYGVMYPVIENLNVFRACVLDENMKQIQTKVEYEGPNLLVTFFSESEEGEWLQNVQATLNLEAAPQVLPPAVPIAEIEQIKAECSTQIDVGEMYERLDMSGISMGPSFRSARKLYMSPDKAKMLGSLERVITAEGEFSFHPIGVDAIVQCFWEYKMCRLEEIPFALPVGINKFVWYGGDNATLPDEMYLYIPDEDHGVVFSAQGQIFAEIEVLTVLHSTSSAFLRSITPGEKLPQFISKDWVARETGISEGTIPAEHLTTSTELLTHTEINLALEKISKYYEDRVPLEKLYEQLTSLYILKSLLQQGWNPVPNVSFGLESVVNGTKAVDCRAIAKFLDILSEDGLFVKTDAEHWTLVKEMLGVDEVTEEIQKLEAAVVEINPGAGINCEPEFGYLKQLGGILLPVLQGQIDPLEALATIKNSPAMLKLENTGRGELYTHLLASIFENIFKNYTEKSPSKKLRILQIGTLDPAASKGIFDVLQKLAVKFEYTIATQLSAPKPAQFTDLNAISKTLDIQKDPKVQGFQPSSYDIVIAVEVLHVAEDLKSALENVRHLLAPNGYLFLGELFQEYRDYAISYALLSSYWKLQDSRGSVTADSNSWIDLLNQTGFTGTVPLTISDCPKGLFVAQAESTMRPYRPIQPNLSASDPAWVIFGMEGDLLQSGLGKYLKEVGRNVFYVVEGLRFDKVNDSFTVNPKRASDFQQLSHVLKNYEIEGILYFWGMSARQAELNTTAQLRKFEEVVTTGFLNVLKIRINNEWTSKIFLVTSGAEEVNPAQGTLWGMLETYFNEYQEATGMGIDVDQGTSSDELLTNFVFSVLWDTPNERGVRFQNGKMEVARLHACDSALPLDEILLPKAKQFKMTDPTSLTFGSIEPAADLSSTLEIAVRAVGLNFRDLLVCNGMLETTHPESVGLEFAGIVTNSGTSNFAVGDRVAGLTLSGAFASHIVVNPQLIFPIPSGISYAGAATIPVAFGTCYLALVEISNVQPKERVLIHTASGGVGLAGIQLARYLGAELFVTAGTDQKRKYLRECLGLTHVYNSRTHDYKDEILRDTDGVGVDVIINTITGRGFKEASLDCLARNGRFIELSKLNIWQPHEVKALRPDVHYTIMDAFDMILNVHPILSGSLKQLTKLFATNQLDILPHTNFPLAQLKSAFKYFHAHNHIGKSVVEIPESADKLSSLTLHNPHSTYMVTGGVGGLGFEIGRYLWANGANVLLVGRSLPSEEKQMKLAEFHDRMRYVQCDVGDFEKCKELIDGIDPPLRGVFHLAGIFANAFLVGQNSENYAKSFQSKVYGTWNLHLLTRHRHLDHFVVFSSVAAVLGSTGLSNYSAANRYMDSLMHYRVNQCGLPGLSIDWGPWAEVGAAVGYVAGMFKNFHHFPPELGIQSMERAMRLGLHEIAIADMDMNIVQSSPRLGPYLSELTVNTGRGKRRGKADSGLNRPCDIKLANLAKEILAETDPQLRLEKMEHFVETMFRTQSGLGETDAVDKDQALTLMGMDSLIGMEMRLRISKLLNVQISANGVMEHNSIRLFAVYLTQLLSPADSNSPTTPIATEVADKISIAPELAETSESKIVATTPNSVQEKIVDDFAKEKVVPDKNPNMEDKQHSKRSLPKFVAKQLQKFHKPDKKLSKNENVCNGA